MPFYEYTCRSCGFSATEHQTVDARAEAPQCDRCGVTMSRAWVPVHVGRVFRTQAGREDRARRRDDGQ